MSKKGEFPEETRFSVQSLLAIEQPVPSRIPEFTNLEGQESE